jgi:hypothetical protein
MVNIVFNLSFQILLITYYLLPITYYLLLITYSLIYAHQAGSSVRKSVSVQAVREMVSFAVTAA